MDHCNFSHAHGDPENEEKGTPFLIANDQASPGMSTFVQKSQSNPGIIAGIALLKNSFRERLTKFKPQRRDLKCFFLYYS